ncbi:MAG: type II toxin-antitoxin system RelE/ParE family toxin [Nitrospiraceae bacterium]
MQPWTLWQFPDNLIDDFLAGCTEELREAVYYGLDFLAEYGNRCGRPHSAPLGEGIFELRARAGRQQARLLYYFDPNRKIVFVVAIFKDQRRISPPDLKLAKQRRQFLRDSGGTGHDFNIPN